MAVHEKMELVYDDVCISLRSRSFVITIEEPQTENPKPAEDACEQLFLYIQQLWQLRSELAARMTNIPLDGDTAKCWQSELAILVRKADEWVEESYRIRNCFWNFRLLDMDAFAGDQRRLWVERKFGDKARANSDIKSLLMRFESLIEYKPVTSPNPPPSPKRPLSSPLLLSLEPLLLIHELIQQQGDRNAAAVASYRMDVETASLIRAAEDILSLTRVLKELWLFGKVHTVGTGEAEQRAEMAAKGVEAGLRELLGGGGNPEILPPRSPKGHYF
ncbi:MAG: hypothetical protein Q9208_002386 [Pyrenodesmia sp. 3 TL-2023]